MAIAALFNSKDFRVTSVIGLAHGSSHFFQWVLPPLFPLLKEGFDVSWAQLGFMVSLFFVTSSVSQFVSGFLVDRIGARAILLSGVFLLAGGIFACSFAPNIYVMYVFAVLMGLGNGVFHPCDFAIMNENIHERRLGYAFSVHGIGGNIGWALSPVVSYALASQLGWRAAVMILGGIGLCLFLMLLSQYEFIKTTPVAHKAKAAALGDAPTSLASQSWWQRATILCFLFMLLQSFSGGGIQSFTTSVLHNDFQLTLAWASFALSAYFVGSTAGVLVGGVAASKNISHAKIAVASLSAAGGIALLLLWVIPLLGSTAFLAFSVMGFAVGVAAPSRDLIVRSVAPQGATGRVYGFVYSGMDIGSTLAPFTFGLLLDHGLNSWVYPVIGGVFLLAMFTVFNVAGTSGIRGFGKK
ncbi:MAG: MFS transporter [Burkholderiales bacterium]|jgi:MFS family permease|nr:MFS transporter [Burkholderiales bacterium]